MFCWDYRYRDNSASGNATQPAGAGFAAGRPLKEKGERYKIRTLQQVDLKLTSENFRTGAQLSMESQHRSVV